MINHQTMLTMTILHTRARGIVQGYEIRALRGGDSSRPSSNQDVLDTGIVSTRGFLPAGVIFVPGNLIVR